MVREVEGLQYFVNKIPLKSVICFFKIYFYGHVPCFSLLINRVDKLLGIMILSSPLLPGTKADCTGEIRLLRRGLSLVMMTIVTIV